MSQIAKTATGTFILMDTNGRRTLMKLTKTPPGTDNKDLLAGYLACISSQSRRKVADILGRRSNGAVAPDDGDEIDQRPSAKVEF